LYKYLSKLQNKAVQHYILTVYKTRISLIITHEIGKN